jgi:hypothetical protein
MKFVVVICDDSTIPAWPEPRVAGTVAASVVRADLSDRTRRHGRLSALAMRYLGAMGRSPLLRWLAVPVLAVPAVFGGYSMMLHFCQELGIASSIWWHVFAAMAGSASGFTALARLGVLPQRQMTPDRPHW